MEEIRCNYNAVPELEVGKFYYYEEDNLQFVNKTYRIYIDYPTSNKSIRISEYLFKRDFSDKFDLRKERINKLFDE